MKFKRILMGIISSTIACGVFAASEWKIITLSDGGFAFSIDTNSITNVSEYNYRQNKQFWVKQLVVQDLEQDGLGVGDYRLVLQWINCSANTFGVKAITEYKKQKNGTFKNESASLADYQVKMLPIIPESVGQLFVRHVCP
ncbi:hypothetical protein [Acinetobacter faecalis]|uniref:hypothetical protein n=1 Tax=Acinetobacter faecalis TaxID=2665161 RepID=UPI002A91F436|nr:hypothetical protein [Acinetobacter faecalis]MDY6490286.1 hypothetical protein [Acinetobacter faecalis]